jgi:hypothetical protein
MVNTRIETGKQWVRELVNTGTVQGEVCKQPG